MTATELAGGTTGTGPRKAPRGSGLATVLALVCLGFAVWNIGVWANHWYIAEQFLYPTVAEGAQEGTYRDITQLLRSGNQALLLGAVQLTIGVALAAVAVGLRRLGRRR